MCNLTLYSFLLNLKISYLDVIIFSTDWVLEEYELSNPPQLYPIPNNFNEFTNFITEIFLLFITIDNPLLHYNIFSKFVILLEVYMDKEFL